MKVNQVVDEAKRSLRESKISMQLIIGCYDNSQDCQGYRDIYNILEKIRLEILTLPGCVLGERFRLIYPVASELLNDNEWPYYFGIIDMSWEAAQPFNSSYFGI